MSFEDWEDALGDENYTFIEDTYMQADELAEHAIPSPPAVESDDEFDNELWQFDYWMDIDYASDGDEIRDRQNESRIARARKRKLLEQRSSSNQRRPNPSKRRKVHLPRSNRTIGRVQPMEELPPVMMIKNLIDVRYDPQNIPLVDVNALESWALIKDWRERFINAPMWSKVQSTEDLVVVPHVKDELDASEDEMELDDEVRRLLRKVNAGDVEDVEDGDEDGDWEDEAEEVSALDPEALQRALRQNLAAIGVNAGAMDEETLMNFAMKMFNSGGDGPDVADEMVDRILGNEENQEDDQEGSSTISEEEEANGFRAWLKGQAEEKAEKKNDEEGSSNYTVNKTAELPTPASSQGKSSISPPVKRMGGSMLDVTTESVLNRNLKRKAEDGEEVENKPKKRFEAPTKASLARTASGAGGRKGRK